MVNKEEKQNYPNKVVMYYDDETTIYYTIDTFITMEGCDYTLLCVNYNKNRKQWEAHYEKWVRPND
jgi:hypothetical protein